MCSDKGRKEVCTFESGGEEGYVRGLVLADLAQVGVEGRVVAGLGEVFLGVFGQAFAVEDVLEMFQSEGVVEDIN